MQAVVLTAYGDIDKLEVREMPDPRVGPDDVEVRMLGASINPIDWKLRSGAMRSFMPLTFPVVLGRDASGIVVSIGANVTRFRAGAKVMGLVSGAYAELVVAPEDAWADIPSNIDPIDAGALPLALLTGAELVDETLAPMHGDVVLVTGAVGSVGRVAVFAAKARGAIVWAGVRTAQKQAANLLGADGVVALDDAREIEKLPLLDGILDTIGGPTLTKVLDRVKAGGTIASVVGEPEGAAARGLVVRGLMTHPDGLRLAALGRAVATGKVSVPIVRRLPLSRIREAHALAENHAGGKILLLGPSHLRAVVPSWRGAPPATRQVPRT